MPCPYRQALRTELSDAKAQLELRDYEGDLQKSREAERAVELEALGARLKERVADMEGLKRSLEVCGNLACFGAARTGR